MTRSGDLSVVFKIGLIDRTDTIFLRGLLDTLSFQIMQEEEANLLLKDKILCQKLEQMVAQEQEAVRRAEEQFHAKASLVKEQVFCG